MCQLAPLGRCSNHSDKEIGKLEVALQEAQEQVSYYDKRYTEEVKAAKEKYSYTDEEISNSHEDDALSGVTMFRNKRDLVQRDVQGVERQILIQELHYDASRKGMEALESSDDHRDSHRLRNAKELKSWQESLKSYKDENGVRLVDKGSNKDQQQALYHVELERAKEDYNSSLSNIEHAEGRLRKINKDVSDMSEIDSRQLLKLKDNYQGKVDVFGQMSVLAEAKIGLLNKAMAVNRKNGRGNKAPTAKKNLSQESKKISNDNGPFAQKLSGIFANQAAGAGSTYFKEVNNKRANPEKTELVAERAKVYEETSNKFDTLLKEKSPDDAIKEMSTLVTKQKNQEMKIMLSSKSKKETEKARAKAQSYENIIQLLKGTPKR